MTRPRELLTDLLDRAVDVSGWVWWSAAVAVAGTVAAVVWFALAGAPAVTGPDELARERAEKIAERLRADLTTAVDMMPQWAVATFDEAADDGFSGTVAVAGDTVCVGVHVTVGTGWILDGDQDRVEVSEVGQLPAERCEGPPPD